MHVLLHHEAVLYLLFFRAIIYTTYTYLGDPITAQQFDIRPQGRE